MPHDHKDPFDELLPAQAQGEGLRLLAVDSRLFGHPRAFAAHEPGQAHGLRKGQGDVLKRAGKRAGAISPRRRDRQFRLGALAGSGRNTRNEAATAIRQLNESIVLASRQDEREIHVAMHGDLDTILEWYGNGSRHPVKRNVGFGGSGVPLPTCLDPTVRIWLYCPDVMSWMRIFPVSHCCRVLAIIRRPRLRVLASISQRSSHPGRRARFRACRTCPLDPR